MWEGMAFAVSSVAGDKVRKDKLKGIHHDLDKSRFNRTGFPFDKESRRDAQFDFFGYKPKRFISIYAKKPKVRVKVKAIDSIRIDLNKSHIETAEYNQLRRDLHRRHFPGGWSSAMAQSPGQVFLMGRAAAAAAAGVGGLGGGQTRSQLY